MSHQGRGRSRQGRPWLLMALFVLLTLSFAIAVGGCGGDGDESADIPAFEAEELTDQAEEDWPTVGGSFANDRYSELDEINTENVGQLKGVWKTDLRNSGVEAKYSGESQPVVWNGVIYVSTGANDVFAVDVETGRILWQYQGNLDPDISTVCCGWLNRGVALGDGKVFQGQLDGKVVALDAQTGRRLWTRQLVRWQTGQTITAAPIYADGRIYIGVVGADFGTRSFLEALDANTGKSVWRYYTIPARGEPGGASWPQDSDAYLRGGGAIWQAPAYDPELGLLYFSTGNAGPDWDGSVRPGDNKWTVSIVAVEAETGEHRWGYQMVHHDIWDLDAASPVVLFEGSDGRPGVAQAGKTGWIYMLDRRNGRPLYGIDEKPVPQDPRQHTAKTQPIPRNGRFLPHLPIPQAEVDRIQKSLPEDLKDMKVIPMTEVYQPPGVGKTMVAFRPGPQGGVNWQPISYNPETDMFYICSAVQTAGETAVLGSKWKEGQIYIGGIIAGFAWTDSWGTFTAINALNGNVAWQKRFDDACYSGTATTKGNLVFNGRNTGELQAYDARNGTLLWSFQTGAGANNTPTIFEHDGKQYVVFLSQGNSLQGTEHGDELWLFGLDGEIEPPKADSDAAAEDQEHAGLGEGEGAEGQQGEEDDGEAEPGPREPAQGDAEEGRPVFANNCSSCHGAQGQGGNGGPAITEPMSIADIADQVANGGDGMPPFKDQLTQKQINDVSSYVAERIQGQSR
jgi:quinohemoprotein ethanol dehydrogenase